MLMKWNEKTLQYEVFKGEEKIASADTLSEAARKMDSINRETFKEAYKAYIAFQKESQNEKENKE